MKRLFAIPTVVTAMLFSSGNIFAQYHYHDDDNLGNNQFYISEGLVTVEQINGWAGKGAGGMSSDISMPSAITGAAFVTYRHFFTKRFALGVTAGLDNVSGDLSYGNPEHNSTGMDGVSGHYKVQTYSFALEALLAYFRRDKVMIYGYTGAGATFYQADFTIYQGIQYPSLFYGQPGSALPSNPYDYHTTYFNAQVTPFGIRFGGTVAGFFELGFGYKGLMSGGLSVKF